MDKDAFLLVFLGVLVGLIASTGILSDIAPVLLSELPQVSCQGCVLNESFMVYYLYPKRCVSCEKNVPPTCDGCMGFYDESSLSAVSGDLGVPLFFVVSDAVGDASVFVVSGGRGFLGAAKSKLSIAQTVCAASGSEKACSVFKDYVVSTRKCFEAHGVPSDTLVYHYRSGCGFCEATKPYVLELLNLTHDGVPYSVAWISEDNVSQTKVLLDCVGGVLDLSYIPQFICPANVKSKTGVMTLSQLRDFADECVEASKAT